MRIALVPVVVVVAVVAGSCDCNPPDPPACTAKQFGLGADEVVHALTYAPPGGCTLEPKDKEVTDEDTFRTILRCLSTNTDRSSGIDFTTSKLFVVAVTHVGDPAEIQFAARDGTDLHVGAFTSVGCSGAAPVTTGLGVIVALDDNVIVHGCQDGPACNQCQPPPP